MLDLQELRVFLAIVESGGFRSAAKKVHITQSAVSQSLKNLERKIGDVLIDRGPPIKPTILGLQLIKHARVMLDREEDFKRDIDRVKLGFLQQLNLAVDFLVNKYYCHNPMVKVAERLPNAKFKVKRLPARKMIQAMRTGEFDIAFGPFQKEMQGFKKVKLFSECSYLIASKANPKISVYSKSPIAFLSESVLLASYVDEIDQRPSKKKIRDYFADIWEIDTLALQISLVKKGLGVTYVPSTTLESLSAVERKKLIVLDQVPFYRIEKPYGVYYLEEADLTEVAQLFLSAAKEIKVEAGA